MNHGGKRENSGRKPKQREEIPGFKPDKRFAQRVMALIGKDIRNKSWLELTAKTVKSAEEYALLFLINPNAQAQAFFLRLLEWRLGKAPQPVFQGDTREDAPELEFGDIPMPAHAAQPGTSGKPN